MSFDADLVVIGGGSGGLAAAKEAAKVRPGLRVTCFDYVVPTAHGTSWGLGGTCVNVGCIPKKLMHYTSLLGHKQEHAIEYGWNNISEKKEHDWGKMSTTILDYIKSLNWSYKLGLTSAKVKYINALVKFVDAHTIEYTTKSGQTNRMTSDKFIISVGGRPNTFTFPGRELCLTSDDLFWQKKNPGKTLVVGASYIALECAGFLSGIGNDVTVMVRSQLLRAFDQMSASLVGELMERKGIRFIKPAIPVAFEKAEKTPAPTEAKELTDGSFHLPSTEDGVEVFLRASGAIERVRANGTSTWEIPKGRIRVAYKYDGEDRVHTEEFDTVLLAIGRKACVDGLGLKEAGVELFSGKVLVDEAEQTTAENIFAIGDCATGIKRHGDGGDQDEKANKNNKKKGGDKDKKDKKEKKEKKEKEEKEEKKKRVWQLKKVGEEKKEEKVEKKVEKEEEKNKNKVDLNSDQVGEKRKTTMIAKERPELTPVAIQAGIFLARRLFGNSKSPLMNYALVATTVFTPDEYGFCGLSQEEAERSEKDGGIGKDNVEVYASRYGNLEISPTHPHIGELRSCAFTGHNQWAIKYCKDNKLEWSEATVDPETNPEVRLVVNGESKAVNLVAKYRNDQGEFVYDVEEGGQTVKGVTIDQIRLTENDEKDRAEVLIKANCLAKLIVDKRTDRVVGFHFVGENAGEVTQGFSLALHLGATKEHFDNLVGIHPTAAEEFTVLDTPLSSGKTFLKKAGCGGGSCG